MPYRPLSFGILRKIVSCVHIGQPLENTSNSIHDWKSTASDRIFLNSMHTIAILEKLQKLLMYKRRTHRTVNANRPVATCCPANLEEYLWAKWHL